MTNSRQWTLHLVSKQATEAELGQQIQGILRAHQQLQEHQRPTLTAHSIYFEFIENSNTSTVNAMTDMMGGIVYPHLRQMEVHVHPLTDQRLTEPEWLVFGQRIETLEERGSIHTLRLHGMALPNPGLCSALARLPNVRTLRLPWLHLDTHFHDRCLGQLAVMLRHITHIEGYTNVYIDNGGLASLHMPSVTHVSAALGTCANLGQLLKLFPGVQYVDCTIFVDTPVRVPDCTSLQLVLQDLQPSILQLPAGSLPSLRRCMVVGILNDTPGRMVYIRNLLRQLLTAAPNLCRVAVGYGSDGGIIPGPSKLSSVRSILLALVGERPVDISMLLNLSKDEAKRCWLELNRALQPKGISFPRDTNFLYTVWRGCSISVFVRIWQQ